MLAHSPRIVTDGLVLCLDAANSKSYPGSGTTWRDLSGNENHFTISGPDYISSNPIHFNFLDNQGDQIYRSSCSFMNSLSTLTTSCWIRFDNINTAAGIISYAVSGSDNEYLLFYDGTTSPKRFALWFDGTELIVNHTITSSVWYNLVNVVSTTNNILYINAQLIQSQTKTGTSLIGNGYMILGQEQDSVGGTLSDGQDLLGDIAQVSIYNRALTAQEIQQNFNATRKRYGI